MKKHLLFHLRETDTENGKKNGTEWKRQQNLCERNSRKGNGASKRVCSRCCHANESGAAAMLTNSNSHCWTHHLLMLHGSSLPPISFSLPIPLSSALARISLFCSLSCSLLLGPGHSRDSSWVGGAAMAHCNTSKCVFHVALHMCVCGTG